MCLPDVPLADRRPCVVMLPLALVSVLVYAVMALVGIGLKVTTLPMVALGAGIGVDYGIYLFSRMQGFLRRGCSVHESYLQHAARDRCQHLLHRRRRSRSASRPGCSRRSSSRPTSALMLTFMFVVNMLAAMLLLPALAAWFVRRSPRRRGDRGERARQRRRGAAARPGAALPRRPCRPAVDFVADYQPPGNRRLSRSTTTSSSDERFLESVAAELNRVLELPATVTLRLAECGHSTTTLDAADTRRDRLLRVPRRRARDRRRQRRVPASAPSSCSPAQ